MSKLTIHRKASHCTDRSDIQPELDLRQPGVSLPKRLVHTNAESESGEVRVRTRLRPHPGHKLRCDFTRDFGFRHCSSRSADTSECISDRHRGYYCFMWRNQVRSSRLYLYVILPCDERLCSNDLLNLDERCQEKHGTGLRDELWEQIQLPDGPARPYVCEEHIEDSKRFFNMGPNADNLYNAHLIRFCKVPESPTPRTTPKREPQLHLHVPQRRFHKMAMPLLLHCQSGEAAASVQTQGECSLARERGHEHHE